MGRGSSSTSLSLQRRKKEATDHSSKEECHGQQKLLVARLEAKFRLENKFTSWRQPEFARRMDQGRQEGDEMRWSDVTRSSHEAGLQTQDKKLSWQRSLQERQKREDELVNQSADLVTVTKRDMEEKKNLKTAATPGFRVVKFAQEQKSCGRRSQAKI